MGKARTLDDLNWLQSLAHFVVAQNKRADEAARETVIRAVRRVTKAPTRKRKAARGKS